MGQTAARSPGPSPNAAVSSFPVGRRATTTPPQAHQGRQGPQSQRGTKRSCPRLRRSKCHKRRRGTLELGVSGRQRLPTAPTQIRICPLARRQLAGSVHGPLSPSLSTRRPCRGAVLGSGYLRPGCRIAARCILEPPYPGVGSPKSLPLYCRTHGFEPRSTPALPWCGWSPTMGIDKGGAPEPSILTPTPPCGFAASLSPPWPKERLLRIFNPGAFPSSLRM